jgi:enamine deaminase RidA (YjgF/YER057c/UK114 family)
MTGRIDARLAELGITLPQAPAAQANYVPYVTTGKLVFVAGQIPLFDGGMMEGKLGADTDIEAGKQAARTCALNVVAQVRAACDGDLDRVVRLVKVGGFVQGTSDFVDAAQVINGASDLFVEIFGDAGRHARFAVTVACLPANAAVELDAVVEIA